ncbi:MAG: hypothetical protein MK083_05775 [Dehalococcoidia bacterium]|nr:hypothetical protein [Dehalococcoidia bacterium]
MHKILSFYEFNTFDFLDIKENQKILLNNCKRLGIKGTIILAEEGINGTICGTEISIEEITSIIYKLNFNPNIKTSFSKSNAFKRLKVKIQPEIVTFDGLGKFASNTGEFIDPEDWDNFIKNKDVEIIDVRNFYETVIGKFPNSKDPNTERFTDFIEFVEKELVKVKNKKIAMYCTGGIRCEKASSYMKDIGFENVYQLRGGIINYLNSVDKKNGSWKGECFVFDERVSLDYGSEEGTFNLCHGCRNPIDKNDKESIYYEEGVSCPSCINIRSGEQNEKSRQRQAQIVFARKRQNL